ncbi:hypothetical protein BX666DRAFT_1917258 [Dichotomocladium elegans]|nr:hypothetical protein BX666DRAFT_1917258 [Dichotomocladium elegans]
MVCSFYGPFRLSNFFSLFPFYLLTSTMDDQVPSEDRNRRGSLAISALLNDVAVDPCRSPLSDDHQQQQRSDYFTHRSDMVMFSSLPASPGCSRREADAIYVPEQRPTTSWDPATAITPDGLHHRKTSKGNIIVASIAKAKRKRISPDQFRRLMDVFEETDTPSSEVREKLAHELGMTKREVQVESIFHCWSCFIFAQEVYKL